MMLLHKSHNSGHVKTFSDLYIVEQYYINSILVCLLKDTLAYNLIHLRILLKNMIIGILSVVLLLALVPILPSISLNHVSYLASGQITPSFNLDSSESGIELASQNLTDRVQNTTNSNITQLATITSPFVEQPITPASFSSVGGEIEQDDDDDNNNDDKDNDNDNNYSDNNDGNDDDNDDDGESGGGGGAFGSSGGAFAFAG